MNKVATDVAAPSSDGELPAVEELLIAGSFAERLEKARAQREIVLALRAQNSETDPGLTVLRKPWEKAGPDTKATPKPHVLAPLDPPVDPIEAGATIRFPLGKAVIKPAEPDAAQSGVSGDTATAGSEIQTDTLRRLGVKRLSAGFVLGLAVGGGLMWLIPFLQDAVLTTGLFDRQQAATLAATGDQDTLPSHTPVGVLVSAPSVETAIPPTPHFAADPLVDGPTVVVPIADTLSTAVLPVALNWGVVQSDLPVSAPERLPTVLNVAPLDPILAVLEVPEPLSLDGAVASLAPARNVAVAPATLSVATENADLPLDRQLLPAALTPSDVVSVDSRKTALDGGPGGFASVTVHVLAAIGASDAELGTVADVLRDGGLPAPDPTYVSFKVKKSHVRYYHPDDLEAAGALAEKLRVAARDFTTVTPAPGPGTIEIWLAGKQSAAAVTAPAKKKKIVKTKVKSQVQPPVASEEQQLQALRDRLLAELRGRANP